MIAEGTEFSDGSCTDRWRGDDPCTQNWGQDQRIRSFLKIHGHQGVTYIQFLDDPRQKVAYPDSLQRPDRERTPGARRVR